MYTTVNRKNLTKVQYNSKNKILENFRTIYKNLRIEWSLSYSDKFSSFDVTDCHRNCIFIICNGYRDR